MNGIEILKVALKEGVKVLPKHFLKDNGIKAKFLGVNENAMFVGHNEVAVYLVEEDGELKDKVVYEAS